jgi:tetratricopeptide (TPR) repeat protein
MKRLLFPAVFFSAVVSLFSQSVSTGGILMTQHYTIISESGAESAAEILSRELELRFDAYNGLFRFDPGSLREPLKVRVFTDPSAYDSYVSARVGQTRPGAVYLHYNQPERRELLVCKGSAEELSMLAHQAFVQYLRGFVSNPPAWIREGFAIYFSGIKFDPAAGTLKYEENLAWLEAVKSLGKDAPALRSIMEADFSALPVSSNFQICSWALVSFLLNNGREDYFRTLVETFMILSPQGAAQDNSREVLRRMDLWTDFTAIERDYAAYLDSRRTFADLMEEGRRAYSAKDAINAELCFMSAMDQRPTHYAPYYYLGLIYYEEKNYDIAEDYYKFSLEYGADEALVSYALGVNALSAGRSADAASWLERAAAADPARYQARAAELINRLQEGAGRTP